MSPAGFRIIARLQDGTVHRGWTTDFRPGRDHFTLASPEGAREEIALASAKAVFFVKTFEGDPNHVHSNAFDGEPKVGRCVWVEFRDGERLAGRAPSIREQNGGFFLFPNDSHCNFARAWVVMKSTKEVLFDDEAEVAALESAPAPPPIPENRVDSESWESAEDTARRSAAGPEPGADRGPARPPSDEAATHSPASDAPRAGEPEKSTSPEPGPRRPHSRADIFLGDW